MMEVIGLVVLAGSASVLAGSAVFFGALAMSVFGR